MFKRAAVFVLLFLTFYVQADDKKQEKIYSREEIEKEIEDAQKSFDTAKAMFNPWYAGPLLTPSPNIVGPGVANVQGYIFATSNTKEYTRSGSSRDIPTLFQLNPTVIGQFGLCPKLELSVQLQALYNRQSGQDSFNFGDMKVGLGLEVLKGGPYTPGISFFVTETFPTGKYNDLDSTLNGVDATGSGSYQTAFTLTIGKVIWWIPTHPMNVRASIGYTVASNTSVDKFNAYGGNANTNGTVNVGNSLSCDFAFEYSFAQKWALASDIVYSYSSPSTFSGTKGIDSFGNEGIIGSSFSDQLSLSPAIEYNPSPKIGMLAGVWFSVWGRNSSDFISGVVTVEYTF